VPLGAPVLAPEYIRASPNREPRQSFHGWF